MNLDDLATKADVERFAREVILWIGVMTFLTFCAVLMIGYWALEAVK